LERNICQKCERLQVNASVARMNSMLSSVWRQLRPKNDREAENQETDAELALRHAFAELERHQRSAHGVSRSEPVGGSDSSDAERVRLRCANG